ncbi:hypothetical protein DFR33_102156 [Bradymonas sediminis]|nr:hypothetical protein DFR33_102156 [Bradymonas sediminis]
MAKINLTDYVRHVLNTPTSMPLDADNPRPAAVAKIVCPGCLGRGRYVGFRRVEDPCKVCNGSGESVPEAGASCLGGELGRGCTEK